jgi:glycosyltransferase involved in cell wall biosynthesis
MPKIAFIIEPQFLSRHWGVRVYLYSLAKVLEHHGWMVDFVYPEASSAGELRWYKLHVRDESLFSSAAPSASGTPAEVWKALRDIAFESGPRQPAPPVPTGCLRPAVMPIGSTLAVEQYDVALVSNPWMVKWRERLPARKTMGLVFDLIPNLFGVMLDDGKPFAFAHQHGLGFRYYEECCDQVLTISEATRAAYLDLVRSRQPRPGGPDVVALPPFAPYHALGEPSTSCPATRSARIALAGCFDLRKGLRELPEILNGLSDVVEEVVIYGGVRCRKPEVEAFFATLQVERVVWHLGATADQVRDIFQRSRMLLFPSKFEGLGLPILEAQLGGCRIATPPVSPMKENALSGAVMLSDSAAESVSRLRRAFEDPFDHAALRAEARAAFVTPVLKENPLARIVGAGQTIRSHHSTLRLASSQ